jgi:pantoate--beta-alanine ligase
MHTIRTAKAMADWSAAHQREGVTIGLVPTMGALHAGHRALIKAARLSCDAVVVSLFVNPAQFGPTEDFSRYPRQPKADAALCNKEGVDVLFAPPINEIYPDGFQTAVTVPTLARRWEGERRPGHFAGVATVVTKLLTIVRPTAAFFGQKDFQQAALIRRLVEDLNFGARVIVYPTVREADGLALSSRNVYLTKDQRVAAPVLFRALNAGRTAIRDGIKSGTRIERMMRDAVKRERLAKIEYLAICDPDTLEPLKQVRARAVLLGAIRIGRIRLIDNLLVNC